MVNVLLVGVVYNYSISRTYEILYLDGDWVLVEESDCLKSLGKKVPLPLVSRLSRQLGFGLPLPWNERG